jgi:hypothetical protein
MDRAEEVIITGQQLLSDNHLYPTEIVEPKCLELQRICSLLSQRLEKRLYNLNKYRELMEHIDKVICHC